MLSPLKFRAKLHTKSVEVSSPFVVQQIIPKTALNRNGTVRIKPTQFTARMVHQEPADKVMRISDTFTCVPVGGQKKARVFESTACHDNGMRLYYGAPAVKGAPLERFDLRRIFARIDVCNIGMH